MRWRQTSFAIGLSVLALQANPAQAQKEYGPGVSDTEIRIGQTMRYSGAAFGFSLIARIEQAYLRKVNRQGGVNGRKINLISLDDAYSPPKAVEQVRKLVEEDEVLFLFGMLGTPSNLAAAKYLNSRRVPQLFGSSGSPLLDDPKAYPWTTTFCPSQRVEAHIFAKCILEHSPEAKIATLCQDDEFGRGYLKYLKEGLGERAATMVVKEASYSLTDATIDSQMAVLKASGADVLFSAATPKFAAQAIRKRFDPNWNATHYPISGSSAMDGVVRPAGTQQAAGLVTTAFLKTPGDPAWTADPAMQEYFAFMKQWAPGEPALDQTPIFGTVLAQQLVDLLRCGDNLTRENVMKEALNIRNVQLHQYVPGVLVSLTPEHRSPFNSAKMMRFDGERWVMEDDVVKVAF
jgi:branched-chain amino acid transport system substrate-binding protein